jgi:probable phosphoglycerate mutase
VEFDAAYASDLSRALETAKTILAGQSNPVSLVADKDLRAISDGIYEGWSIADAVEAEPRMAFDGQMPDLDFSPPKGESIRQAFLRQQEVASRLTTDRAGHRILVVGHGWELRLLAAVLLDREPEWFWKLEPLYPASVSVIELHEGSASIACWNQTRHLTG